MDIKNFLNQPLYALKLLTQSRTLMILAFLPGLLTILAVAGALALLWNLWLEGITLWLSVPLVIILGPIFWLVFGNLAIVPVEDSIVDAVQVATCQKIQYPSPPFTPNRFLKEILYSLSISLLFLFLALISLLPGFIVFSYVIAAWTTAWSFSAAYQARKNFTLKDKLRDFFSYPIGNFLLGFFLNLLLFVPVLNIWLLGYALILSTLVAIDRNT